MANPITISVKSRWEETIGAVTTSYDIDDFGDFKFNIEAVSKDFTVTRDATTSKVNGDQNIKITFAFTLSSAYITSPTNYSRMLINLSIPPTNIAYSAITGVTEDLRTVTDSDFSATYSVDNWVSSTSLILKASGTTIFSENSNWGFEQAQFYFTTTTSTDITIPAGAKYKVTFNKFKNAPNTKPVDSFDLKVVRKDFVWGGCQTWCIL